MEFEIPVAPALRPSGRDELGVSSGHPVQGAVLQGSDQAALIVIVNWLQARRRLLGSRIARRPSYELRPGRIRDLSGGLGAPARVPGDSGIHT